MFAAMMDCNFDDFYGWLNRFDRSDTHLDDTLFRLYKRAEIALEAGAHEQVFHHINLARQIGETLPGTSDRWSGAELHCRIGYLAYQMRNYQSAILEFQQSVALYESPPHHHNQAIAAWLLGCTFWRLARLSDAISYWIRSKREFQWLVQHDPDYRWYQEKIKVMSDILNAAIDMPRWP